MQSLKGKPAPNFLHGCGGGELEPDGVGVAAVTRAQVENTAAVCLGHCSVMLVGTKPLRAITVTAVTEPPLMLHTSINLSSFTMAALLAVASAHVMRRWPALGALPTTLRTTREPAACGHTPDTRLVNSGREAGGSAEYSTSGRSGEKYMSHAHDAACSRQMTGWGSFYLLGEVNSE